MNEPSKIPAAFAASGDKNTIPATTTTPGAASWSVGFPAITSVPVSQGGLAPTRADFNGILNALSLGLMWVQQGNHYGYDETIDYNPGALVSSDGALYFCKQTNGPGSEIVAPGDDVAVWGLLLDSNGNSTINTTGHAGNATRATQDGAGNNIVNTYLAQADAATTYATKEEDVEKLPLSGGTMTGEIIRNGRSVVNNTNDSYTGYYGGTDYLNGAYIRLDGKDSSYQGDFRISATDGTQVGVLLGRADGTLTWAGKTVECVENKSGTYIKFSDGTQICRGSVTVPANSTYATATYSRAFKSNPNVLACSQIAGYCISTSGTTATTVNIYRTRYDGTTSANVTVNYWAIGEGVD